MGRDVIVACDFDSEQATLDFLARFDGRKPFVKIGMELFYATGPEMVREIRARGHKIFLDLKLHDIPNTVKKSMAVLSRLDVDIVNLHASGTVPMMEAALEGLTRADGTRPLLIAVTQLTSTDSDMLKNELYYDLENKSYANLLTLTLDGQTIDLSLYDRAPEGAVSSNYLFGDAVYGLNLNNLSKTVPASAIWEMLGVSYNDVKSMIEPVLESLKNAAAFDITKLTEKLSQAIENNCTISAADGQADTVVITVSFNKEQLLAVSQKIIDTVKEFMTYLGSASGSINGAEFDKALKALEEGLASLTDASAKIDYVINAQSRQLICIAFSCQGSAEGETFSLSGDFNMGTDPAGSESYIFSVTAQATGEDAFYTSINAVIERSSNADGVISRKLTVKTASEPDGEFTAALAAEFTLNRTTGEMVLRAESSPYKLSITGTAAVSENSFSMTIADITVRNDSSAEPLFRLEPNLSLTLTQLESMPQMPEYKDIFSLSQEEYTQLLTALQEKLPPIIDLLPGIPGDNGDEGDF